jgi:hypothetical protein
MQTNPFPDGTTIRHRLGYLMDNDKIAQQVMDGTFSPPEGTDPVAAKLLEKLQMEDSVCQLGPLDMSITPEDNRSEWKKQKERTALEPTGLGFSHYKTACLTDNLNEVDSFLQTAPLQLGISPTIPSAENRKGIVQRIVLFARVLRAFSTRVKFKVFRTPSSVPCLTDELGVS